MDRQTIVKQHQQFYPTDYRSIDAMIEALIEIQKQFPDKEVFIDDDYDWYDTKCFYICTRELETDEMYNRRLKMADKAKAMRKATYKALKKEFENEQ